MKKKLILGSFLALAGISNAQWGGSGNIYNDLYRDGNVGIGNTTTPATKLEVISDGPNDGLQVTQPNTGGAFLLLNAVNGKKYSVGATGTGYTPSEAGDFSIYDWSTPRTIMHVLGSNGNVGFGTKDPWNARVKSIISYNDVQSINYPRSAGLFETTASEWGTYVGVKGTVNTSYSGNSVSGSYGVVGEANSTKRNTGVSGTASGGYYNNGGYFEANGANGTTNGIYAIANNGSTAWNDWAGNFAGQVIISGDLYHNLSLIFSDRRFKKDIKPLENTMEKINKISGYTYKYRSDEFKEKRFDEKQRIGLIAQEVKLVFPELIREDDKGFLAVSYEGLIPVLLEGIKELNSNVIVQQKQIEDQAKQIAELKAGSNSQNKTGISTGINQLNSIDGFALDQNIPNPFSHETVINYALPKQIMNASLIVYDLSGKQITSFPLDLNSKSITVNSEKLSAGIYIYSVMADGKIMDSKRMVVAEK